MAFVKEACVRVRGWEEFVLGGNSVGGYTAMAMSADNGMPMTEQPQGKQ